MAIAGFVHTDMPASSIPAPPAMPAEDAWDIAAHVLAQARPTMAGLDRDYPDLAEKPADTPYGPWAVDFPPEQFRFGPFGPIEAALAELRAAAATDDGGAAPANE
jgi:thiosulfate dehydrogenase